MEFKNSLLMLIATVGTLVLLALLLFFPIPDKNAQIFLAVFAMIGAFFFGSSINKQRPPLKESPDEKPVDSPSL